MHEDEAGISVSTLDATEQARLWLTLGAEEAQRTMLAAVRTALLLAPVVVVDRNQLLDGVFFLTTPPDLLAWQLGLPPGSRLPLLVRCEPLPVGDDASAPPGPDQAPPWTTADGGRWGADERSVRLVQHQLARVEAPGRTSSALTALTGGYADDDRESVLVHHRSDAWRRDAPPTLPPDLWHARDRVLADQLVADGRHAWAAALREGRAPVVPWRVGRLRLEDALAERHRALGPRPPALADVLLALREREGDGEPFAPSIRAKVVRWLDGEKLPELSEPVLETVLPGTSRLERECALRWWSRAYDDAIADRDGVQLLELHNVDPHTGGEEADRRRERETAWGLREAPRGRWARVRDRLPRRRAGHGRRLGIDGDIVEDLGTVGPTDFAALRARAVRPAAAFWRRPSSRHLLELAGAVRDLVDDRPSRLLRVAQLWVRIVAVAVVTALVTMREADLLPDRGAAWGTVWVVLAVAVAVPWDDAWALLRLRSGRLQSTVRVR